MSHSSNRRLCRLCVTTCNDFKSLYDDQGHGNLLYEMTFKYFHPTIVDLEMAKDFTNICRKCCDQIWNFHNFQMLILEAQLKFADYNDGIATIKTEQDDTAQVSITVKVENKRQALSDLGTMEADVFDEYIIMDDDSTEYRTSQDNDEMTSVVKVEEDFTILPLDETLQVDRIQQPALANNTDPNTEEKPSIVKLEEDFTIIPLDEPLKVDGKQQPALANNTGPNKEDTCSLVKMEEDFTIFPLDEPLQMDGIQQPALANNTDPNKQGNLGMVKIEDDRSKLPMTKSIQPPPTDMDDSAANEPLTSIRIEKDLQSDVIDPLFPANEEEKIETVVMPDTESTQSGGIENSSPQDIYQDSETNFKIVRVEEILIMPLAETTIPTDGIDDASLNKEGNILLKDNCQVMPVDIEDYSSTHHTSPDNDEEISSVLKIEKDPLTETIQTFEIEHTEVYDISQDNAEFLEDLNDPIAFSASSMVVKEEEELELIDVHNTSDEDEEYTAEIDVFLKMIDTVKVTPKNETRQMTDLKISSNDQISASKNILPNKVIKPKPKWIPNIKCVICSQSFPDLWTYRTHFRIKHPNKVFYVSCCNRKFQGREHFDDHVLLHNDPNAFKCKICGAHFIGKKGLHVHIIKHHSKICPNPIHLKKRQHGNDCNDSVTPLTLSGKDLSEVTSESLDQATTSTKSDTVLSMEIEYLNNETLDVDTKPHINLPELDIMDADPERQPSSDDEDVLTYPEHNDSMSSYIKCVICSDTFDELPLLTDHFKELHPNEVFYIECCSRKFRARTFKEHLLAHLQKQTFKCELCDQSYESYPDLEHHLSDVHPGSLKYRCHFCGKNLKTQNRLEIHLSKFHTNEDGRIEYACRQCNHISYTEEGNRKHCSEAHMGNREHIARHGLYACVQCSATFQSVADMLNHTKRVHPQESNTDSTNLKSEDAAIAPDDGVIVEYTGPAQEENDLLNSQPEPSKTQPELPLDVQLNASPILKCVVCPESYQDLCFLKTHFKQHHPNETFYIECCFSVFTEDLDIEEHLLYHEDPNTFKCNVCDKMYTNSQSLRNHRSEEHPDTLEFICKICGKGNSTRKSLNVHITTTHNTGADGRPAFTCQECGHISNSLNTYRWHMRKEHPNAPAAYKCYICVKSFMYYRLYREHMAIHKKKYIYACAFCPKKYRGTAGISQHRLSIHPQKPNKNFYTKIEVTAADVETYHNDEGDGGNVTYPDLEPLTISDHELSSDDDDDDDNQSPTDKRRTLKSLLAKWMPTIKCIACPETFQYLARLHLHFRQQHSGQQFAIECCSRQYKTHNGLQCHLLLHQDPDAFKCKLCGKQYQSNVSLNKHRHLHHAVKHKLACKICGQGINTYLGLKLHLATIHQSNMRLRSKRKATVPGAYACQECGHNSASLWAYRKHRIEKHTRLCSYFQCNICGKRFRYNRSLAEHLAGHQKKKTHKNNKKTMTSRTEPKARDITMPDTEDNSEIPKDLPSKRIEVEATTSQYAAAALVEPDNDYKAEVDAGASSIRKSKGFSKTDEQLNALISKWLPTIKCTICPQSYPSLSLLTEHFNQKHPREVFYVACCLRKYKTQIAFKDHLRFHEDPEAYKCNLCDRTFDCRSGLRWHLNEIHPGNLKYSCKICGKGTSSHKGLKYHKSVIHGIKTQPEGVIQADGRTVYTCHDCGHNSYKRTAHYLHRSKMHSSRHKSFRNICKKSLSSGVALKEHIAGHQKKNVASSDKDRSSEDDDTPLAIRFLNKPPEAEAKNFDCTMCDHKCEQSTDLNIHYKEIHKTKLKFQNDDDPAYECRKCEKKFKGEKALLRHIRNSHSYYKGLKCVICGSKDFTMIQQLREHMAAHRNRDIYRCLCCPKTFRKMTDVSLHQWQEHPNESEESIYQLIPEAISYQREPGDILEGLSAKKPKGTSTTVQDKIIALDNLTAKFIPNLKCFKCPQTFEKLSLYRQHFSLEHINDRFGLRCCGRKLTKRFQIEQHMLLHNSANAFQCPKCGISHLNKRELTEHMAKEHREPGQTEYPCKICNKVFHNQRGLITHAVRHTKKNEQSLYGCEYCEKKFLRYNGLRQHLRYKHSQGTENQLEEI